MTHSNDFSPSSSTGLADFRRHFGDPSREAVDGGLILFVTPTGPAKVIGGWWLTLDAEDHRLGALQTRLCEPFAPTTPQDIRAAEVERYMANLLLAARKVDLVRLVRQGSTIDYRAQGKVHDERLDRTLAELRAKGGNT